MTVDHIKPRAAGGSSKPENLQPLCLECHNFKTGREKHGNFEPLLPTPISGSQADPRGVHHRDFGTSPMNKFLRGRKPT